MHLGGRLNENQGTNKACNNVLWQAGYKTGQTVLHLRTACSIFLFFFSFSSREVERSVVGPDTASWKRTCSPIDNCQVTAPTHQVWSLDGNRCPLRDFLRSRTRMTCFIYLFWGCMCVRLTRRAACIGKWDAVPPARGKSSVNESDLWPQQVWRFLDYQRVFQWGDLFTGCKDWNWVFITRCAKELKPLSLLPWELFLFFSFFF